MFDYITGKLISKDIDFIVLEVGGIGFKIYSSAKTISEIGENSNIVTAHTYLNVREDDLTLYGFSTKEELYVFEMLISVSGIGPKVAMNMLSTLTSAELSMAIVTEDVKSLTRCRGVGAKTAQRIVLELKDKMKKSMNYDATEEISSFVGNASENNIAQDAISALMVLGYNNKDATNAVSRAFKDDLTLEEVVKEALKNIS